jgi:hypothetical protein
MINAIGQLYLEGESAEKYLLHTLIEYVLVLDYVLLSLNIPFQVGL